MAIPEPLLTPQDRDSHLWLKLKAEFERRLDLLRRQNDNAALSLDETNKLRGRIVEVKRVILLGSVTPIVDDESEKFKD